MARTDCRHVGYAVDEASRTVWLLWSSYARKDQARERAWHVLAEEHGAVEITLLELYPVSQQEAVCEMAEVACTDQPNDLGAGEPYTWGGDVELVPGSRRADAAARLERELAMAEVPTTASALIDEVERRGYRAAYSKGGNVWADAPRNAGLDALGMVWSAKRCQWWAKCEDAGTATTTSMRRFRAPAAPKAA